MYIQPDTILNFMENIPLNTNREHTLYFDTKTKQTSYFSSSVVFSYPACTYQRWESGVTYVDAAVSTLLKCNYMSFINKNFENKLFYAYVTGVEYVNNELTKIYYEIDEMQTFYFDYSLNECFVERQHVMYDDVFGHTLPEPIEPNQLTVRKVYDVGCQPNGVVLGLWLSEVPPEISGIESVQSGVMTNLYNGISALFFDSSISSVVEIGDGVKLLPLFSVNGTDMLKELLQILTDDNKSNSIIAITHLPDLKVFTSGTIPGLGSNHLFMNSINVPVNKSDLNGWKPKNNRLFSYPYNYVAVSDGSGNSKDYRYEFFDNKDQLTFTSFLSLSPNSEVITYPENYNGVLFNPNEAVSMNSYPQAAYSIDTFAAWLAQQGGWGGFLTSSIIGSIGGLSNAATSAVSGDYVAAGQQGLGVLGGIVENSINVGVKASEGATPRGSAQSSALLSSMNKDIKVYQYTLRYEYARVVDNYLTMFGYSIKRLKIPNLKARENFTYIKTIGCSIVGGLPANYEKLICDNFNRGITFWVNPEYVGDYSVSNKPLGGD